MSNFQKLLADIPAAPGVLYLIVRNGETQQLIEQTTSGNVSAQRVLIPELTQETFDAFYQSKCGVTPKEKEPIVVPKLSGFFGIFPSGDKDE